MKLFADMLQQYFEQAAAPDGVEERRFVIGGHHIAIRFCQGRWSDEMTTAMSHLAVRGLSSEAPALTISMWDGRSAPQNHPLRAYLFTLTNWWHSYTGKRGDLLDLDSERVMANYHPGTGILTVVDTAAGNGFYWKKDDSPMPYYEACSPFRSLLHGWMRTRNSFFVHGAAIGTAEGGVLLVGKGGSGKSTTTLACLRAGLQVAGDDYCIVDQTPSGFTAHSLYSTAKLVEMHHLEAFPELCIPVLNPVREAGEKVAVSLSGYQRDGLIDHVPLRAILVPVIAPRDGTTVEPCSAHEALMAVAPSTLSQLPASGAADLRFLSSLTRGLPCYRISLGRDLRKIPVAISSLLASLHTTQPARETELAAAAFTA